jgi:Fe2+ or Zn2+ uptake regulation protein
VTDLDAIAAVEAAGHRFTKSRQLILTTLARLARPSTIPAILAAEPKLSQSSLYRNLMILEEAGLVSRLTVGSDYALFELSEQLTARHHHHLVCRQCHTVADIDLPARAEKLLDRTLAEATAESGFTLEDHRLDLVGLCSSCSTSD